MTKFKVGDQIRVLNSYDGSKDLRGQTGTIQYVDDSLTQPIRVIFPNLNNKVTWPHIEGVKLLPQTQELGLEDVYTVCPLPAITKAINEKAGEYGLKSDTNLCSPYIFYSKEYKVLDAIDHMASQHTQGKKEVSIPQFLDLLTQYSQRKKEVKVQLNANLVATVDQDKGLVNVVYGGNGSNEFTFQQLLDFQQALKAGGHGFKDKDYVDFPSRKIGQALYDYAASNEVPVSPHQVEGKVDDQDTHLVFGNDGYFWPTRCTPGKTKLTIDQFLTKCQSSPLPTLAGYEVTKTPVPGSNPDGAEQVPGFKVGCQYVTMTQFDTLMDTITNK